MKKSPLYTLILLPGLILFGALFLYPSMNLVLSGLLSSVMDENWWRDPFFRHVTTFTYGQALLSATLSGIVGTAGAVFYSELRFPGRTLLWRLSLLGFSLPAILVVLSLVGLWGRRGVLGEWLGIDFYGWPAILLAHVFFNYPLFLKAVGTALVERDRREEMAALSLGAGRLRVFLEITLPKLFPEMKSAFVLSFLYCASSFLVVLMLGGGPYFTTLEVAIYQAVKVDFDPALAVRLACVQAIVASALYLFLLKRDALVPVSREGGFTPLYRFRAPGLNSALVLAYFSVLGLLVAAPLATLVGAGLSGLRSLPWREVAAPALTSLKIAAGVATLATGLALSLAHGERHAPRLKGLVGFFASLPMSLSALVLTLALMVTFPELHARLRGEWLPIVVIQSLVFLPVTFRAVRDGLWRIPDTFYEGAASLGASPWRTLLWVELPLLRGSLALAAVLAAGFSLGEVGSVLLFSDGEMTTIPLWMYRLMGQYRFDEAYAVGAGLLVMVGLVFWASGRWEHEPRR